MPVVDDSTKSIRGDKLSPDLQQVVLARWTNRHYSKPGHKWTAEDDQEWLAKHKFCVTVDNKIDMRQRMCYPA
jgi:hypothetical protein